MPEHIIEIKPFRKGLLVFPSLLLAEVKLFKTLKSFIPIISLKTGFFHSANIAGRCESLFENSYATPREGTRPTGNGQNSNLLQARSPDRAGFQIGSEVFTQYTKAA